jgi:hypothetical protein
MACIVGICLLALAGSMPWAVIVLSLLLAHRLTFAGFIGENILVSRIQLWERLREIWQFKLQKWLVSLAVEEELSSHIKVDLLKKESSCIDVCASFVSTWHVRWSLLFYQCTNNLYGGWRGRNGNNPLSNSLLFLNWYLFSLIVTTCYFARIILIQLLLTELESLFKNHESRVQLQVF